MPPSAKPLFFIYFLQEHDDDAALEEALRAATASKQAVANKVQEFKQQQQLAQLIQAVSRRLGFDETTLVDILQSHGMAHCLLISIALP